MKTKTECRKLFDQLLKEGVDKDEIIAGAGTYAEHMQRTGETPIPMADWLKTRGWEQYRQ